MTIEAWTDLFATWRDELRRKLEAGQHDLAGELSEGVAAAGGRAPRARRAPTSKLIEHALRVLRDDEILEAAKHDAALGQELYAAVERNAERHGATRLEPALALEVDRVRARFGSWYELFPRSFGGLEGRAGAAPAARTSSASTSSTCRRSTRSATRTARAATTRSSRAPTTPARRTRSARARAATTRSSPALGTIEDVRALCAAAAELDMDIALDFAINCSPDHPWLKEHPDWFHRRPDGTLKYAENPPKKYQDIYNVNWDSRGLARRSGRSCAGSS